MIERTFRVADLLGGVAALLALTALLAPAAPAPLERAPRPEVDRPTLWRTLRWDGIRWASVAFDRDARTVALGEGPTGIVQVRRLPDGKLLQTIRTPGITDYGLSGLTVSPDGRTLASIAPDRTVSLSALGGARIDLASAIWVESSPLAFHPDGRTLAIVASSESIHLWDVATGKRTGVSMQVPGATHALAFSPCGKVLAAGHYSRPLHEHITLWDARTGAKLLETGSLAPRIGVVAFRPDSKLFAAADHYGNLKLFATATGKLLGELKGHTDMITALAFAPEGRTLASGARQKGDSTVRLWDVATGRQRAVFTNPGGVWALAFRRDGRVLHVGSADGVVRLWDMPGRWKR